MGEEDDWVRLAMTDDNLVGELLLKLNQAESFAPPPPRRKQQQRPALVKDGAVLALSVDWSVRQRRSSSKQAMMFRRKATELSTRASPTTPLSFSGATSVSGGATDGFDEAATTSLPAKLIDTSRSKVASNSGTPTIKRTRRKKTLPELREQESLLLKERRHLKNQLATLRVTLEKQRVENERLNRRKLDLLSRQRPDTFAVSLKSEEVNLIQHQQIKVAFGPTCSVFPISGAFKKFEPPPPDVSFQIPEDGDRKPSFVLPDLNLPVEGDSSSNILHGLS